MSSLSEANFLEFTGISLKDFLVENYTNNFMNAKEIADLIGCSEGTIYKWLKFYKLNRNSYDGAVAVRKKSKRKGEYANTPIDIEIKTGRPFIDIIRELNEKGLSPSEMARELKLTNQTHIRKVIKEEEYKNIPQIYPNVFKKGRRFTQCEEIFYEKTGLNLRDVLYDKYVNEGLSTYKIAALFKTDNGTIYNKIKIYGFNRDRKSARKKLIENGDVNYKEIGYKARATMKKSISHSNNQEMARELFKAKFEKRILFDDSIKNLEVIIGYNEWSILKVKEVDIPIIIYDNKFDVFYKYAIEYNGDKWHTLNKTKDKMKMLNDSRWKFKIVVDDLSFEKIEIQIEKIVNEIISEVLKNQKQ